MFFTPELLSRRDSGFGLLWLAATLGAKSSFKKLPRRSVTSADIVQLCNLIADPPEPLALRLSSNLMIGAARVYKVKQELFLADVTTCFTTLKKAVQEMRMPEAVDLQMAQNSARLDAVTVRADPSAAFAIQFEHLFPDWDRVDTVDNHDGHESDEEYDPSAKRKRKKASDAPLSQLGPARGNVHTLDENYDHLLSMALDASFNESGLGIAGTSSSQAGFGFEDDFFGGIDTINDIGDELARELGDGWGALPEDREGRSDKGQNTQVGEVDELPDLQANALDTGVFMLDVPMDIEAVTHVASPRASLIPPQSPQDVEVHEAADHEVEKQPKKLKRVRLLLDSRTELTNEELQRARNLYMEEQSQIRRELEEKRAERHGETLLEEMISGVPRGVNAPVLVDFLLENFKVQVEARSGQLFLNTEGEPPTKRRRIGREGYTEDHLGVGAGGPAEPNDTGMYQDMNFLDTHQQGQDEQLADAESRLRSSEEPEQARRLSRPPSRPGSYLEFNGDRPAEVSASQRSAVFPWDNAGGVSSSAAGAPFELAGSDRFSVSIGRGRRSSSLGSRRQSPLFAVPDSPGRVDGDGFEFNMPERDPHLESQHSDVNLMTLERHSFDFLEYCKIQLNAFPSEANSVSFDDIVPVETSTAHVAAAAFYHCLVLATKDLLRIDQNKGFAPLRITIK